jgi:hypothetical protein
VEAIRFAEQPGDGATPDTSSLSEVRMSPGMVGRSGNYGLPLSLAIQRSWKPYPSSGATNRLQVC